MKHFWKIWVFLAFVAIMYKLEISIIAVLIILIFWFLDVICEGKG
jgi:hypothetical protein